MSVRLVHFSDIHISARPLGWQWSDWLSKRVTGWIHTRWGSRRWRFRQADDVLSWFMRQLEQQRPDCIVFSGDATMLGFPAELDRAAAVLRVADPAAVAGFAVPGNHDYYIPAAQKSGAFEQAFAPWLQGQRVDDAPYPFARQVGHLWLIGLSAGVGHWLPHDASGAVDAAQLTRLDRLLAELGPGPRILVTHYPICDAQGQAEDRWHELRNLAQVLDVARKGRIGLWLHGHRHEWYALPANGAALPFPVICAGSSTESGHWGYNEYVIEGSKLRFVRYDFDPVQPNLRSNGTSRELELGSA